MILNLRQLQAYARLSPPSVGGRCKRRGATLKRSRSFAERRHRERRDRLRAKTRATRVAMLKRLGPEEFLRVCGHGGKRPRMANEVLLREMEE